MDWDEHINKEQRAIDSRVRACVKAMTKIRLAMLKVLEISRAQIEASERKKRPRI